jgi:nucleotide-binding universal stress UspA family protein
MGGSLAGKYGAKLLLLHIIPKAVEEKYPQGAGFASSTSSDYEVMTPGIWTKHPLIVDLADGAHTELRDFAYNNLKDAIPVQINVAVGKPAEEILRVAREEGVDIIVMGTHGRTGVRHLLLGSVAEAVHPSCPLPGVYGAYRASSGPLISIRGEMRREPCHYRDRLPPETSPFPR